MTKTHEQQVLEETCLPKTHTTILPPPQQRSFTTPSTTYWAGYGQTIVERQPMREQVNKQMSMSAPLTRINKLGMHTTDALHRKHICTYLSQPSQKHISAKITILIKLRKQVQPFFSCSFIRNFRASLFTHAIIFQELDHEALVILIAQLLCVNEYMQHTEPLSFCLNILITLCHVLNTFSSRLIGRYYFAAPTTSLLFFLSV